MAEIKVYKTVYFCYENSTSASVVITDEMDEKMLLIEELKPGVYECVKTENFYQIEGNLLISFIKFSELEEKKVLDYF